MEDITIKLLDEIISEVSESNTDNFNTFTKALLDTDDALEDDILKTITDYVEEYLAVGSDSELSEISNYEKEDLVDFLKNLDY